MHADPRLYETARVWGEAGRPGWRDVWRDTRGEQWLGGLRHVEAQTARWHARSRRARFSTTRMPPAGVEAAQVRPCRCRRLIRRCLRSCGDQSGMPAARHAFAMLVRIASAPLGANKRPSGSRSSRGGSVASIAAASPSGRSTHSARPVFDAAARRRRRASAPGPRRAHGNGAAGRRSGGRRPLQQGDREQPFRHRPHRRRPPQERVRQAGNPLPNATRTTSFGLK